MKHAECPAHNKPAPALVLYSISHQGLVLFQSATAAQQATPNLVLKATAILLTHNSVGQKSGLGSAGQFFCWSHLMWLRLSGGWAVATWSRMASPSCLVVGAGCWLGHVCPTGWPGSPTCLCSKESRSCEDV